MKETNKLSADELKYSSPYPSEVTYKSDKNFLVRLKALVEKSVKAIGAPINSGGLKNITDQLDNCENYLFESKSATVGQQVGDVVKYAAVSPIDKKLIAGWYKDVNGNDFQLIAITSPATVSEEDSEKLEDEIFEITDVEKLQHLLIRSKKDSKEWFKKLMDQINHYKELQKKLELATVAPPVSGDESDELIDIIHRGIEFSKTVNTNSEPYKLGAGYGYSCGFEAGIQYKSKFVQPPVSGKEENAEKLLHEYWELLGSGDISKSQVEYTKWHKKLNDFIVSTPIKETVTDGVEFAEWMGKGFEMIINEKWECFSEDYCEKYNLRLDEHYTTAELYTLFQKNKNK